MSGSVTKTSLTLFGHIVAVLVALFAYLESSNLKSAAKSQLAVGEVAFKELAERVAHMEGREMAKSEHCRCVPRESTDPEVDEMDTAVESLGTPEPVQLPAPSERRVQKKAAEYTW